MTEAKGSGGELPRLLHQHQTRALAPKQCFVFDEGAQHVYLSNAPGQLLVLTVGGEHVRMIPLPTTLQAELLELSSKGVLAVSTGEQILILTPGDFRGDVQLVDFAGANTMAWSQTGGQLAAGGKNGSLLFLDLASFKQTVIVGKHSKRVTSLSWSRTRNLLLSISEDKAIGVSKAGGESAEDCQSTAPAELEIAIWLDGFEPADPPLPSTAPAAARGVAKLADENSWGVCAGLTKDRRTLFLWNVGSTAKPVGVGLSAAQGRAVEMKWDESAREVQLVCAKGGLVRVKVTGATAGIETGRPGFGTAEAAVIGRGRAAVAGEGVVRLLAADAEARELARLRLSGDKAGLSFNQVRLAGGVLLLSTTTGLFLSAAMEAEQLGQAGEFVVMSFGPGELRFKHRDDSGEFTRLSWSRGAVSQVLLARDRVFVVGGGQWSEFDLPAGRELRSESFGGRRPTAAAADAGGRGFALQFGEEIFVYNDGEETVIRVDPKTRLLSLHGRVAWVVGTAVAFALDVRGGARLAEVAPGFDAQFVASRGGGELLAWGEGGRVEFAAPAEAVRISATLDPAPRRLLFDTEDSRLFVAVAADGLLSPNLVVRDHYRRSPFIQPVREVLSLEQMDDNNECSVFTSAVDPELSIVALEGGRLTCFERDGGVATSLLSSHAFIGDKLRVAGDLLRGGDLQNDDRESLLRIFFQSSELRRFSDALFAARLLDSPPVWKALADRTLQHARTAEASECLRHLGRPGDAALLTRLGPAGLDAARAAAAAVLGDDEAAVTSLIKAGLGKLAVRCRLAAAGPQKAIDLAKHLGLGDLLPGLQLKLAEAQLMDDDLIQAGKLFDELVDSPLRPRAMLGQARIALRRGAASKAMEVAAKLPPMELAELAAAASEASLFREAAELSERAGDWNAAAEAALSASATGGGGDIVVRVVKRANGRISAPATLLRLSEHFQAAGDWDAAEDLLRAAGDPPRLVAFLLARGQPDRAEAEFLARCPDSALAAGALAEHFIRQPDRRTRGVAYFVRAGRRTEALEKALELDALESCLEALPELEPEEALSAGLLLEAKGRPAAAGRFFKQARQFERALDNFLKASDYSAANELVSSLKSEELFEQLVNVYEGADGREPADPVHLFRLLVLFGRPGPANSVALATVAAEFDEAAYRVACRKAAGFVSELGADASFELRQKLHVLESYALARKWVKLEDHALAAQLLALVAGFLHWFPKHATSILKSAVVESTKAGFRHLAYAWATALCKPDCRPTDDPRFLEKIEKIALKPVPTPQGWPLEANPEAKAGFSKCLVCAGLVENPHSLSCPRCAALFTHCSASGRALLSRQIWDVVKCRACGRFAGWEHLEPLLGFEDCCPACEHPAKVLAIRNDPPAWLVRFRAEAAAKRRGNEQPTQPRSTAPSTPTPKAPLLLKEIEGFIFVPASLEEVKTKIQASN